MKTNTLKSLLAFGLALCLASGALCSSQSVFSRAERVLQTTTTTVTFTAGPEIQQQCEDQGDFVEMFTLSAAQRKELRAGISEDYTSLFPVWANLSLQQPGGEWIDSGNKYQIIKKSKYFAASIAINVLMGLVILLLVVWICINIFKEQQLWHGLISKLQENKYARHAIFFLSVVSLVAVCVFVYLWIQNFDPSVIRSRIRQINCGVIALRKEIIDFQQAEAGGGIGTAGLGLVNSISQEIAAGMGSIDGAKLKAANLRSSDMLNRWSDVADAYDTFKSSYTSDSLTYQGSMSASVKVKSQYLIKLKTIIEKDLLEEINYYQFITSRIWNSSFVLQDFDSAKQTIVKQVFSDIAQKASTIISFVDTMYQQYFNVGSLLIVVDNLNKNYTNLVVCILTLCGWQLFILIITGYFDSCRVTLTHFAKLNLIGFGAITMCSLYLTMDLTFATTGGFYACNILDRLQTEPGAFKNIFGNYTSDAQTISSYIDTCLLESGSADLLSAWQSESSGLPLNSLSKLFEGIESYTTVLPNVTTYKDFTVGGGIDRNLTYFSLFKLMDKGIPADQDYREAMERFNTYRCALEVMNYNTSMCIYNTTISFSTNDDQYDKRIGREYCMAYGSMPFTHCYANRYKNRNVTCINGTPEEAGPLITSGCKSAKSFSDMMVSARTDPKMDAFLTKVGWAFQSFTDANFKSGITSLVQPFPKTAAYLSKSQSQLIKSFKCDNVIDGLRALENQLCFRSVPLVQAQIGRIQTLSVLCLLAGFFTLLSERMVNTSIQESFGQEQEVIREFNKHQDFQRVPGDEVKSSGYGEIPSGMQNSNQIEMQATPQMMRFSEHQLSPENKYSINGNWGRELRQPDRPETTYAGPEQIGQIPPHYEPGYIPSGSNFPEKPPQTQYPGDLRGDIRQNPSEYRNFYQETGGWKATGPEAAYPTMNQQAPASPNQQSGVLPSRPEFGYMNPGEQAPITAGVGDNFADHAAPEPSLDIGDLEMEAPDEARE